MADITVPWPPRNNSAAIFTNLGRFLVRTGAWLHGFGVNFSPATPIEPVPPGEPTEPEPVTPGMGLPTPSHSWLSEWIRKITGNKKIPDVIQCQRLETKRILVIGEKGLIELTVNNKGRAAIIMSNGSSLTNAMAMLRLPDGTLNALDLYGPTGTTLSALDMTAAGEIQNRIPPPGSTPPPVEPPPDGEGGPDTPG